MPGTARKTLRSSGVKMWSEKYITLNKLCFHQIAEHEEKFRIECYLFFEEERRAFLRKNLHKQFARVLCIINLIFFLLLICHSPDLFR